MHTSEREPLLLLSDNVHTANYYGLSVFFAVVCIVDVFGVFPVVALPKSIIDCGFYGVVIVVVICSVQMYTAILLGRCWLMAEEVDGTLYRKNRYPYSALAEMTYGRKMSKLVTFLLDVTIFGGGIPNLIVASQNLQMLTVRISDNSVNVSFCYWLIMVGTILCPFLWMGSPKDMKVLCTISVTIVLSVLVCVWICILSDNRTQIPIRKDQDNFQMNMFNNVISAYGILVFQFDIHPNVLTIQVDMKRKNKIGTAIVGGFAVSITMFSLTCILAAAKYGDNVEASLLQGLPPSISLHIAALLVALQLGLSSAMSNSALYQHLEDWLGIPRAFNYRRCLVRTLLTILAVFIAESVPRFDLVMSLFGGTLTGPLVFILPPLFFLKMLRLRHNFNLAKYDNEEINNIVFNTADIPKNVTDYFMEQFYLNDKATTSIDGNVNPQPSKPPPTKRSVKYLRMFEILYCLLILVFGIVATIVTTYKSLLETIAYASFYPPCIFNITAATHFINN